MTLEEAIISKISHDLAGGIGALMNTVDLMKMDDTFAAEGMDLLHSSSMMLNARLKFFRALYGAENKTINTALVTDYLKTLAPSFELKGDVSTRLQLAMILVGIEILSLGGKIEVGAKSVKLSGEELRQNSSFIQALVESDVPVSTENVAAVWLVHLAKEKGKHVHLDTKNSDLVLTIA